MRVLAAMGVCLGAFGLSSVQATAEPVRIQTYNIMMDKPSHKTDAWDLRRDGVIQSLHEQNADIFAVQEAFINQVRDLATAFPTHGWVGVGRFDGAEQGEHSAVFYRKDRFELVASGVFWLSATPDVPGSKSWGSSQPRVTTWERLREKPAGGKGENEYKGEKVQRNNPDLLVFGTHFDHLSGSARLESAKLILRKADELKAAGGDALVVVMGDFNSSQDAPPYREFTAAPALRDAQTLSVEPHIGPDWSFTKLDGLITSRLDFVFVDPRWQVLRHGISAMQWEGRYPSDHLPVIVDLEAK
jgi:endonuclease/exonuclease/phosphatase family metal-dependent hydrolase